MSAEVIGHCGAWQVNGALMALSNSYTKRNHPEVYLVHAGEMRE